MSTNNENAVAVLGLETATDRKSAEYDLVKSLLAAAAYQEDEEEIVEAEIKRKGKFMFAVHLHPIGDKEVKFARKQATEYAKNPQGAKYPKIEKGFDNSAFNSWLIYLATTDEDREKIWGNPAVMSKRGLMQPVDTIDELLRFGEKAELLDLVSRISGFDEDEEALAPEDFAKK